MQPIHLGIGVVEGLATAAVVSFVLQARPEALVGSASSASAATGDWRRVAVALLLAAVVVGGALSWFASTHPDGLEWSMAKVSGKEELESPEAGVHESLAHLQEKTAFLPDYGFKAAASEAAGGAETTAAEAPAQWPAVNAGTSVAGLVGGALTLLLAGLLGFALKRRAA
jgi:cobalt/nickel transport system permease protein